MPADSPTPTPGRSGRSGRSKLGRVGASAALGAAVGVATAWFVPWQAIPLLVWVGAALTWLALTWVTLVRIPAGSTRAHATIDDPRGPTADAMLLTASVASLGAVVLGILKAANSNGGDKWLLLITGVAAIVSAWGVVHTVFTLRYAALYFRDPTGGVDFNEDGEDPDYADFAYLAFTIGMTYQVSDTDLRTKAIRHTALRHALLSYLFGTVIIAATINIAAGLAH